MTLFRSSTLTNFMRVDRTSPESCGGLVGHDDRQVELVRDGVQLLHGRVEHAVRGPR